MTGVDSELNTPAYAPLRSLSGTPVQLERSMPKPENSSRGPKAYGSSDSTTLEINEKTAALNKRLEATRKTVQKIEQEMRVPPERRRIPFTI